MLKLALSPIRTLGLAIILVLIDEASGWAQTVPWASSLGEVIGLLERHIEQISASEFDWELKQVITHSRTANWEAQSSRLQREAEKEPEGSIRRNTLLATKQSMEELASKPTQQHANVHAEIISPNRYRITEKFHAMEGSERRMQDIYCDGDGFSFVACPEAKTVFMSDKPADVFQNILTAIPELYLRPKLSAFTGVPPSAINLVIERAEDKGGIHLHLTAGRYELDSVLDGQIGRVQSLTETLDGGIFKRMVAEGDEFPGTPFRVVTQHEEFREGKPYLKQSWRLTACKRPINPAAVDTKYRIQPQYTVTDVTGGSLQTYRSDRLLPKGRKQ